MDVDIDRQRERQGERATESYRWREEGGGGNGVQRRIPDKKTATRLALASFFSASGLDAFGQERQRTKSNLSSSR